MFCALSYRTHVFNFLSVNHLKTPFVMVLTYPIYSLIFFVISLEYHRQKTTKIQFFFQTTLLFFKNYVVLSLKNVVCRMTPRTLESGYV